MPQRRTISPVWFWVVSGGLHAAAFAALWGASMFGHLGNDYDTAPKLAGVTSAAAAHRSSSLGDITVGEGRVCLQPAVSSPEERAAILPRTFPATEPAFSEVTPSAPAKAARSSRQASSTDASLLAATVRRQAASLPAHGAKNGEIAEHSGSATPMPHVLPRARASVVESSSSDLPPTALPRLSAVAAVMPRPSIVEVTGLPREGASAAGGRFIRRTGHVGRDGSVGDTSAPEPLANRPPVYPEVARQNNWDGTVLLRLRISGQGRVERVEVATSSGHKVLDEAAVEAVREWGFDPAKRAGQGVSATVLLPIVFDLRGTAHLSEFSTWMSK